MKPRNPREAAWWNQATPAERDVYARGLDATPEERVAWVLAHHVANGRPFPDIVHLTMIRHRLGAPTITRLTPPKQFDPTAPCNYPGCTNPIGAYQGGRYPTQCETHRHLNRNYAPGMRRTKGTP